MVRSFAANNHGQVKPLGSESPFSSLSWSVTRSFEWLTRFPGKILRCLCKLWLSCCHLVSRAASIQPFVHVTGRAPPIHTSALILHVWFSGACACFNATCSFDRVQSFTDFLAGFHCNKTVLLLPALVFVVYNKNDCWKKTQKNCLVEFPSWDLSGWDHVRCFHSPVTFVLEKRYRRRFWSICGPLLCWKWPQLT